MSHVSEKGGWGRESSTGTSRTLGLWVHGSQNVPQGSSPGVSPGRKPQDSGWWSHLRETLLWHPLLNSRLGNPTDREAWQAAVHGVAKSRTRPSAVTHIHWAGGASTARGHQQGTAPWARTEPPRDHRPHPVRGPYAGPHLCHQGPAKPCRPGCLLCLRQEGPVPTTDGSPGPQRVRGPTFQLQLLPTSPAPLCAWGPRDLGGRPPAPQTSAPLPAPRLSPPRSWAARGWRGTWASPEPG